MATWVISTGIQKTRFLNSMGHLEQRVVPMNASNMLGNCMKLLVLLVVWKSDGRIFGFNPTEEREKYLTT